MTKEELLSELQNNNNLLPRDILNAKRDISELAELLKSILEDHREELEKEQLFRDNFINSVNYVYLDVFDKMNANKKKTKNKPFNKQFMDSVFSLPAHA